MNLVNPNADIYLRSSEHISRFIYQDGFENNQLVERNKKWVLYDDAGNVVIVASDLRHLPIDNGADAK